VYFSLSWRYSGNARPACRINHTGGRSTPSHRHAAINRWRQVSRSVFSWVMAVIFSGKGYVKIPATASEFSVQLSGDGGF
jgi:hypothetical protein